MNKLTPREIVTELDKYIIGQSWKYQDVLLHYYQGAQLVSEDWNDYYCN